MDNQQSLFHIFIRAMNKALRESTSGWDDQKRLLKRLIDCENEYRKALIRNPAGKRIYREFMDYIVNERKNILDSRVFFRERQNTFDKISMAFRKRKPEMLYKFRINYSFVDWSYARLAKKTKVLTRCREEIIELRKSLCENSLPLVLNQAKIFWSKVPESKLEYMDLIQTAASGLMNAIDKFVPPYSKVFRSVGIGRMKSNMIEDYSATLIKLSPKERRILYRANKARNSEKLETESEVLAYIRESFPDVTVEQLRELTMAATGVVSMDSQTDESNDLLHKLSGPPVDPEANDLKQKLMQSIVILDILESKVVRLRFGIVL